MATPKTETTKVKKFNEAILWRWLVWTAAMVALGFYLGTVYSSKLTSDTSKQVQAAVEQYRSQVAVEPSK